MVFYSEKYGDFVELKKFFGVIGTWQVDCMDCMHNLKVCIKKEP